MGRKSNGEKKIRTTFAVKSPLCPGDIVCPKCKGTGWEDHGPDVEFESTCKTCWGTGKLDWIEAAMGKQSPMRRLKANWTIEVEDDLKALYSCDMQKEMVDILAQELSEKVDEEIMGKIIDLSITKTKLR